MHSANEALNVNVKYSCQFPQKTNPNLIINVLFQNIRSIRNKITEITNHITYSHSVPHIIVLNETWLKDYETDLFNIPGYNSFHSTRKKTGGGVSIYVLKSFSNCNQIESFESDNSNFLIVEIERLKIKVGTIYRPPSSKDQLFIKTLDQLLENQKNILIFGDTNYDIFDAQDSNTKRFTSTINNNGFLFLNSADIHMYTRKNISENTYKCIDHVFTDLNMRFNYELAIADIPSFNSDHRAILLSVFSTKKCESTKSKTYEYTKIDHEKIIKDNALQNIPDDSFENFLTHFQNIIKKYTKTFRVKDKFRKPFMNTEIFNYMKIRDNYHSLLRKYKTNQDIVEKFKFYRRKVVSLIRKAQLASNDKVLSQNIDDTRKVWKHLNNILRNRDAQSEEFCSTLNINGNTISNRIHIADHLNNYFVNVASEIKQNILANYTTHPHILEDEKYHIKSKFENPVCTEDEVKAIIKSLKSSDAQDIYGMSNNLVKRYYNEISKSIAKLINNTMEMGDFPDALKIAIVKPLFKGGNKKEPKNYRPISILPIISKVLEAALLSRLSKYLTENQIINERQFGFVAKSNTEAAVLHLLNNVYENIENKKITAALLIDCQKAFDCLDKNILIQKLKKLELPRSFLQVMISFLNNRKQCVKNNETISSFRDVISGVPQGSILGPTCFLIYVNSIMSVKLNGKLQMYADDCASIYGESNLQTLKDNMEKDLAKLKIWMDSHFISMNALKTNYIIFSGRTKLDYIENTSFKIQYSVNSTIERVNCVKYLGLFIDKDLKFDIHIDHVKKKILPMTFAIRRIRSRITDKIANQLYFSHIYSHLTFMNPLWSAVNKENVNELFILQKKAIKIMNKKDMLTPSAALFTEKILPLPVINDYHLLILAFKIKHNLIKHISDIRYVNEIHSYNTRNREHFFVVPHETRYGYANFYHRGLIKFNELCESVKKYHTIKIFKTRLKEHLFTNYLNGIGI